MEQKTHSQKFLRQRKFLLVLPLLILPFLTLMFWVLGGGKVNHAEAQQAQNGLNMQLPGANLKDDKPLDKLSYYEKAASDSLRLQQLMQNDPYYRKHTDTSVLQSMDTSLIGIKYGNNMVSRGSSTINHSTTYNDPNERKVYQKLAQLDDALDKASSPGVNRENNINTVKPTRNASVNSSDIDRLEQMMQGMNQSSGEDPEMKQLNGTLEKILDIQHPDRVREKIKQTSETKKGQVFAVAVNNDGNSISLLDNRGTKNNGTNTGFNSPIQSNTFYSLDDETSLNESQNSIPAVIHETQTLVNGSTVKLRLMNDIFINGVLIPKDNFVFGTADLNGERLFIKINSIRYRNSLFPVELSVCDMDGMEGIYIPGAITRDVAKQSADRATQQIDLSTLNPSIGAQAANAGIEAAKTLFSRKVKLVKVTVKAGYQVLLRDEKQKQDNNISNHQYQ
jgi:conjugative transposon TraM protein